jgi:hypothetical protein
MGFHSKASSGKNFLHQLALHFLRKRILYLLAYIFIEGKTQYHPLVRLADYASPPRLQAAFFYQLVLVQSLHPIFQQSQLAQTFLS